jgi:hypothetical protein
MTKAEQQKKKATRIQSTSRAQAKIGVSKGRVGLKRKNTYRDQNDEQYKRGKDDNIRSTIPEEEDVLD